MDIFHRHREAQEHESAAAMLELALQTPEYRPEALIWKGIDALPNDPKLAFIFFSNAAHALPERADVHALLGRSMLAQGQPDMAARYLAAVWQKIPHDPSLRMMLWQARSQSASPAELRRLILAHLPDITVANELNFVLKILAAQTDVPGTVGVVRYLPEEKEIQGWAVDLRNVHAPATLELEANGQTMLVTANVASPLLAAAGLPTTHGGIRIKVPNPTLAVTVRFATGLPLLGSPVSAMPTFVPPEPVADGGKHHPVDVLIPIYDGLEETLECINSAIAARKLNRTPHRLVVLDDATPIVALRKALKVLASRGKITLIQQPVNLGFIRTMNRAMALSPRHDVVWLNADTRVHGNWLDRLRDTAYGADDIASVTPFTNNGELMSFPVSRVSSPMPTAAEQAELDTLAGGIASAPVELETGCGFCLYIKRTALESVGYLDEVELTRGYGEETDWCLKAKAMGWRHLGATDVFIAHKGGVSFREEKKIRVAYNNAVLRRRYPKAEKAYLDFCQRDPLQPARNALQKARLKAFTSKYKIADGKDNVLKTSIQDMDDTGESHAVSLTHQQLTSGAVATVNIRFSSLDIIVDYDLSTQMEKLAADLDQLLDMRQASFVYSAPHLTPHLPKTLTYKLHSRLETLVQSNSWTDATQTHCNDGAISFTDKDLSHQRFFIESNDTSEEAVNFQLEFIRNMSTTNKHQIILIDIDASNYIAMCALNCVMGITELPGLTRMDSNVLSGCSPPIKITRADQIETSTPLDNAVKRTTERLAPQQTHNIIMRKPEITE
ncbi:glycosyltransferase family 2 protein [Pseudomonas sp. CFBP 8771]|nr:glycosyltransferase family 2 protein [Pseudomonas sp. CFBP 8771]